MNIIRIVMLVTALFFGAGCANKPTGEHRRPPSVSKVKADVSKAQKHNAEARAAADRLEKYLETADRYRSHNDNKAIIVLEYLRSRS